jgi:hypothetical protein
MSAGTLFFMENPVLSIVEVLTFVCLGTRLCQRCTTDDRRGRLVVGLAFLKKYLRPGKRIQDEETT